MMDTVHIVASHRLLDPARALRDQARDLAALGFAGAELSVVAQGALTPQTPEQPCIELRESFRSAGLNLCALYPAFGPTCTVLGREESQQKHAGYLIAELARRAQWLGATVITAAHEPGDRPEEGSPTSSHAQRLACAAACLARLIPEAETCGVRVALPVPVGGMLATPTETAELIDRVNSPWIGVCLDVCRCAEISPAEWIDELGWRLTAVRADECSGEALTSLIQSLDNALMRSGFQGPLLTTEPFPPSEPDPP